METFTLKNYASRHATRELACGLSDVLQKRVDKIVCVGTDRSTGDSLGPLVGTMLKSRGFSNIVGDLESPIHAENLDDLDFHPSEIVLAIDASLGTGQEIGKIMVRPGPLRPGLGVKKKLQPVGNYYIAGVVNVGGFMEYMVLQDTRLGVVYQMPKVIADAICESGICA